MLLLLHKLTTFFSPLIIYRVQALDQNDEEVVLSDDNHVYVLSSKHFSSPNCISRSISSSIDDWRKAVAASFLDLHIGSVWIRIILHLCFPLFLFFFLFFFLLHVFQGTKLLFMHSLRTVHGTHHHFIQKKILKIGLTALFTHLKIILLRYFQFSVFSKISCIQMDP